VEQQEIPVSLHDPTDILSKESHGRATWILELVYTHLVQTTFARKAK